jgi:hypothetical protein
MATGVARRLPVEVTAATRYAAHTPSPLHGGRRHLAGRLRFENYTQSARAMPALPFRRISQSWPRTWWTCGRDVGQAHGFEPDTRTHEAIARRGVHSRCRRRHFI